MPKTKAKPTHYHAGYTATKDKETISLVTAPYSMGVYCAFYVSVGAPPKSQGVHSYVRHLKLIQEHIAKLREDGWEVEDYRTVPIPDNVKEYL